MERETLPQENQQREENKLVSLGAWPGFGEWPTWSGGTINRKRPLPRVVDREGGGVNQLVLDGEYFFSQVLVICDNLAAERTENRRV